MPTLDPRVDAYIAQCPDFARPILSHLRELVHAACPDVVETIKWSKPHFMYEGMLCGMSAFTAHCAFGYWQGALMFPELEKESMGHYGRLTSLKDLPSKKVIIGHIKQAMQLNRDGVKLPARVKSAPKPVLVPAYFAAALKANKAAHKVFDAGSPSFRREYVDWLEEAKTEATRQRRMDQALEWLAEGKARNWKYQNC